MTRVLVVASSAVLRAGLESILREDRNIEVVGSATGPVALPHDIESSTPDVVLVEIDSASLGTLPAMMGTGPPAIVVLTDHAADAAVLDALRIGVRAVLPRDAEAAEITSAVHAADQGLVVVHPEILAPLLSQAPALSRSVSTPTVETLTPRELEVLAMMAEGDGNKQIARRLGISEHTVKFHVGSILAKLGAASRTEAVTLGLRQGLIMV